MKPKNKVLYGLVHKQTRNWLFDEAYDQHTLFDSYRDALRFKRDYREDTDNEAEIDNYEIIKLIEV